MICIFVKWMISQSLDSGKPLSKFAERHADRCKSCHGFLLAARSLDVRLAADGVSLGQVPAYIEDNPGSPCVPAHSWTLAMSSVCILLLAGLIVVTSLKDTMSGDPDMSRIASRDGIVELLSRNGLSMDAIGGNPESRFSREIVYLARDARSAARFLTGPISFGIPDLN